ncbi:hypothetical protein Q7P37_003237 [Cladosporium fusiforme]
MSEVTFAKTFLSSLDKRPIKLPADHVGDPKQYPNQSPAILPRQTHPFPRRERPSSTQAAKQTVSATLKPMRGGETITIPNLALEASIYEIKEQYAKQTSLPHEKIKVLLNKKPAADLKTLKELGVTSDVEFSVMILGGGGATPSAGTPSAVSPAIEKADPAASVPEPAVSSTVDDMVIDEQSSFPGSEKAQIQADSSAPAPGAGPSGPGALNTIEFWNDLQDFLSQRLRDTEEAQRLSKVFKMAWVNQ